jgi:hypothetical protein
VRTGTNDSHPPQKRKKNQSENCPTTGVDCKKKKEKNITT